MTLTPFLRSLVFISLLGLCLPATARPDSGLPSIADVQQSIESLADRKLPETEQKNMLIVLTSTLQNLEDIDQTQKEMAELEQRLKTAPEVIKQSKAELIKLDGQPESPDLKQYANSSLEQLQQQLAERNEQLSKSQKILTQANSIVINAQSRPERAQSDVNQMLERSQQINTALSSGKINGKPLSKEARVQLLSERELISLQTDLLKEQMASNDILLDLGTSLRDLEILRSKRLDNEMLELQTLSSNKRREESEKAIEQFSLAAKHATPDSLFAREAQANLELSTDILATTDQLSLINRRNLEVNQQLDSINQTKKSLDENINVLRAACCWRKSSTSRNSRWKTSRLTRGWRIRSPIFACASSKSASSANNSSTPSSTCKNCSRKPVTKVSLPA